MTADGVVGIPVVSDPEMPEGQAEFRNPDGSVAARIVGLDGADDEEGDGLIAEGILESWRSGESA